MYYRKLLLVCNNFKSEINYHLTVQPDLRIIRTGSFNRTSLNADEFFVDFMTFLSQSIGQVTVSNRTEQFIGSSCFGGNLQF